VSKRLCRMLEEEVERLAEERYRSMIEATLNTITEYTAWLRREVVMKVVDAKVMLREGRVEEALKTLDELLAILDL